MAGGPHPPELEVTLFQMAQTTFRFPGVNVCCALSHPISQTLALVPRNLGLKRAVRHEDTEGVSAQANPKVFLEFLTGQSSA